jgi:hypothetical protein
MIDHEHKLIFIHIQRTGGTIIERKVCGNDLWWITPSEKHLTASQAKKKYSEYWNDYFKFSIIRDPWARTVSKLQFYDHFWISLRDGKLANLDAYKDCYRVGQTDIILESDYRFTDYRYIFDQNKHKENQIYLNILDEELDYIGKFEELSNVLAHIEKQTGAKLTDIPVRTPTVSYEKYFDSETQEMIADWYKNDIEKFNYSFGDGKLLRNY